MGVLIFPQRPIMAFCTGFVYFLISTAWVGPPRAGGERWKGGGGSRILFSASLEKPKRGQI